MLRAISCNRTASSQRLPFQIASAQTIAKRGFWPALDVLVVDEAHTMHSSWVEFAQTTQAAVIGLSATPFTKGLGQVFTRLINATTMAELTESGVLVPMRVLSCVRPDMAGAAVTKSGEWSDKAAEERGMAIVGDVVAEWMQHGEGRKTIVFGGSIAHCKELCRQFTEAGVMAAVFTSLCDQVGQITRHVEEQAIKRIFRKGETAEKVLSFLAREAARDVQKLRESVAEFPVWMESELIGFSERQPAHFVSHYEPEQPDFFIGVAV